MKYGSALCLLAILFAGVLPASAKTPHGKIRVLIVDGFSNHDWQQNHGSAARHSCFCG
jgi:hypothetical protein